MVTKSCCAWRLALGGKRWTFIMIAFAGFSVLLHYASRYPVRTFKIVKTCCVFGCANRSDGKEKRLSFHRLRQTDVHMFCKDCQVVQDECEDVPWKTEQTKREDKDEKKNKTVMTNQTKTYQTKNDDRTRRSWNPGWPDCRKATAK